MTFSSTMPNAYDTRKIAEAKIQQIGNGGGTPVVLDGTIHLPRGNDSFDCQLATLEKILQAVN